MLVTEGLRLKICDFGISRSLGDGAHTTEMTGNIGTIAWSAPEMCVTITYVPLAFASLHVVVNTEPFCQAVWAPVHERCRCLLVRHSALGDRDAEDPIRGDYERQDHLVSHRGMPTDGSDAEW